MNAYTSKIIHNEFTPEKLPYQKERLVFQPSFFRAYVKLWACIYSTYKNWSSWNNPSNLFRMILPPYFFKPHTKNHPPHFLPKNPPAQNFLNPDSNSTKNRTKTKNNKPKRKKNTKNSQHVHFNAIGELHDSETPRLFPLPSISSSQFTCPLPPPQPLQFLARPLENDGTNKKRHI